jgi:ATP-dependent protease ClpP protease subunit
MQWQIKAQAEGTEADIYINDFIGDWIDDYWGFGVTSRAFLKQLQELSESVKTVRLHLNTPGGDVVAATHIANLMRDQREHKGRAFEVLIEGAAWSAGTIITSAGKEWGLRGQTFTN